MKTNIQWPDKSEINLVEAFILADRIHEWIGANERFTRFNFLTLTCLHWLDDDEKWAASFDSLREEEWFEFIDQYPCSAYGACPEDAIYKAAMKLKGEIEKL